jgi:hypothetical protein
MRTSRPPSSSQPQDDLVTRLSGPSHGRSSGPLCPVSPCDKRAIATSKGITHPCSTGNHPRCGATEIGSFDRRAIVRGIERTSRGLNTQSTQAKTRWNATDFLGGAGRARTDDYQIMSNAVVGAVPSSSTPINVFTNWFDGHSSRHGLESAGLLLGGNGGN